MSALPVFLLLLASMARARPAEPAPDLGPLPLQRTSPGLDAKAAAKKARKMFDDLSFFAHPKVDVDFQYRHESDGVTYSCAKREVRPGPNPIAYFACDSDGLTNPVIAAGRSLWVAGDTDDRLAYVVAHELGHVVLDFGFTVQTCALKGFKERLKAEGKLDAYRKPDKTWDVAALRNDFRRRVDGDADLEKKLTACSREQEDAADDYARVLIAKAGFDPLQGSTALAKLGDLAEFEGAWGIYLDSTHTDFTTRFSRMFDAAFIEGGR